MKRILIAGCLAFVIPFMGIVGVYFGVLAGSRLAGVNHGLRSAFIEAPMRR